MTETAAIRENYNLGVLAGEAREQQRIIKLLEGMDCEGNGNPNHDDEECFYFQSPQDLIALIKGEK